MKTAVMMICAGVVFIASCSKTTEKADDQNASGIYVREYTIEVSNPESGNKIGMRQIRDSIFIDRTDDGYQVSNRKWSMNDFDNEGWKNMAHADDRPMATFRAAYDESTHQLIAENSESSHVLYIENGTLLRNTSKDIAYKKVD